MFGKSNAEQAQPKSPEELEKEIKGKKIRQRILHPLKTGKITDQRERESEDALKIAHATAKKDLQEQIEIGRHIQQVERPYELASKSGEDGLTGLMNNKRFMEMAASEVALYLRQQQSAKEEREGEPLPLTFIMIDLNLLKSINDTHGHAAGSEAIKMCADFLKERFGRKSDLVARYGGDEFSVLATGDMGHIHERLGMDNGLQYGRVTLPNALILEAGTPNEVRITLTMSVGLAPYLHKERESVEDSVSRGMLEADTIMYQAKRNGEHR